MAFRTYRCPSHLKTFYAWLFKKIDVEDLKIGGEFFPMTWDQAMMFPMLEMAGDRHAFIKETLYVYNMTNPINDNRVNAKLQRDLEKRIRSKPSYDKLRSSPIKWIMQPCYSGFIILSFAKHFSICHSGIRWDN